MICSQQWHVKCRRNSIISVIRDPLQYFHVQFSPFWFRHQTEEKFLEPFLKWSLFLSKHQRQKCFQKEKNKTNELHNKQQPTESAAEIIRSLKNTYVLTAIQQCCHSRKTSVEETDSDLQKKKKKQSGQQCGHGFTRL